VRWTVETDPATYAARVLPWLERDPVGNTVQATLVIAAVDDAFEADPLWLAWLAGEDGEVAGVALRTPPRGILVSALPAGGAVALADVAQPGLPGAAGPPAEVRAFLRAYAARHHVRPVIRMRQRLFRLDELLPPPPPAGRLREAVEPDVPLMARWYADFAAEMGDPFEQDWLGATRRVVTQRRLLVWEAGGEPVSMVAHRQPVVGVPRVGPVYTPPEHRRRGYAAATTAGTCERLLRAGARAVVLFADIANPTSTGVYLRLGFRPVAEQDDWSLEY
jgi:RimJ/RimL family protein N-acetyltransferase